MSIQSAFTTLSSRAKDLRDKTLFKQPNAQRVAQTQSTVRNIQQRVWRENLSSSTSSNHSLSRRKRSREEDSDSSDNEVLISGRPHQKKKYAFSEQQNSRMDRSPRTRQKTKEAAQNLFSLQSENHPLSALPLFPNHANSCERPVDTFLHTETANSQLRSHNRATFLSPQPDSSHVYFHSGRFVSPSSSHNQGSYFHQMPVIQPTPCSSTPYEHSTVRRESDNLIRQPSMSDMMQKTVTALDRFDQNFQHIRLNAILSGDDQKLIEASPPDSQKLEQLKEAIENLSSKIEQLKKINSSKEKSSTKIVAETISKKSG